MAIESSQLFQIKNLSSINLYYDFTPYITLSDYEVNSQPVYEEWTDANYVKHRVVTRQRVSGSFNLLFIDHVDPRTNTQLSGIVDYERFMRLYKSKGGSDTLDIESKLPYFYLKVYVNNLLTEYEGQFFMDISPSNEVPYLIGKPSGASGFNVTIEEM